jgi:formiminotetrahydrofolate cyclodeaminase
VSYGTLSLAELLDAVGAATPAPASGTAAAYAAALGAALAELAAGVSRDDDAVAEARGLRTQLVELADEDAEAYTAFMRERSDETKARIVEVPQEISAAAAQVAKLGERLVRDGKASVAGDAQAAVELANGARRAADNLVALNQ